MEVKEEFKATNSNLPTILKWVEQQVTATDLEEQEMRRVQLAIEEAVVNIIEHSGDNEKLTVILTCRYEPNRQIEFELKDKAAPFNPLLHPEPDVENLNLEEATPGGLGVSFMRKCMDALFYRHEDGCNILTLIKNTHSES